MFKPGCAISRVASRIVRVGVALALLWLQGCAGLPAGVERSASHAFTDTAATPLARIADASLPEDPGLSGFRILPTGDYAFDARIALARGAQRSIDAQYYQVHDDGVGLRFLRELRDAAARGVRVRLLIDDFYTTGQDPLLQEVAALPGIELRLFNPLPSRAGSTTQRVLASLHEFARINHRMHNKLFVADNAFAVAGGRNIGDEYFNSGEAANFIDMDVIAAGPVVRQMSRAFDRYWNSEHTYPLAPVVGPLPPADEAAQRFAQRARKHDGAWAVQPRDMFGRPSVGAQLAAGRVDLHPAAAQLLVDSPDKVRRKASEDFSQGTAFFEVVALMRNARSEVVMASPYFIPGERGVQIMREAVGQGVRIRVLTNAADATDEPLVHFAYAKYRHEMLHAGVEIHEVGGELVRQASELGILRGSYGRLHAKVATIDRRFVIVGSMNLDSRSARANTEQSLVIDNRALTAEVMSLVERSGHVAGSYRLRLADDGQHIEWVSRNGEGETVTRSEPGATPLSRLWLWLLSHVITEDLL
jgi:putative cardiolipin synthase